MEENKFVIKKNGRGASKVETCCLHGNGCCSGHHFSFLRIFLGIVLLLFVFCGGFKLGVLVGLIGSHGMDGGFMMEYRSPRYDMMRWDNGVGVYNTERVTLPAPTSAGAAATTTR